jgi:S1-C subfamily serine protease
MITILKRTTIPIMRTALYFGIATVCLPLSAQPISQHNACTQFSDAVVSVNAGGVVGTGFIVSADGLILTANHVVRGGDGMYFAAIMVKLSDGSDVLATPVDPLSAENIGQDFALLRIDTKRKLTFLTLGSVSDVALGADATIIGYPFSAISSEGKQISTKFCLSASFTAVGTESIEIDMTNRTPKGPVNSHHAVPVDVIYFQGPSVKGISGSPIISRDTGKVVGIVSTKLTGIGSALERLKVETANGLGGGISISGLNPGPVIHEIVTVMDNQLSNGMGSATGIDDPKLALWKEEHKRK